MGVRQKNISGIRNDNFHEAIFFGQPLGFSSINNSQYGNDILLQMQALVCRLLAAILSVKDCSYLKSSVNTRVPFTKNKLMLTPRRARCSTPPALKASFSTGGVCYRRRGGGIIGPLAGANTSIFGLLISRHIP